MRPVLRKAITAAAVLILPSTAVAQIGLTSNVATVALTATKNATLTVTPNASTATLASITDGSNVNNFTLGTGSAQVTLESFQGTIQLIRPGGEKDRERQRERHHRDEDH